jgi:hypothetical protein
MNKLNRMVSSMIFETILEKIVSENNITIEEARNIASKLSFREYVRLSEAGSAIIPPSGNTIGPSANATAPSGSNTTGSPWPGNGAPVEVGMTVGLKGPNGLPVPGQVSQVDMAAKGVKVKNPSTGQDEWQSLDTLSPFMASDSNTLPQTNTNPTNQPQVATEEAADLARMRKLAGIKENCSAGATGAGSIVIAPAAMGGVKRREPTDEELKKEYTRTEPAKTIIGDTKPHQASGELSANLAASGMKSAGRANNGMKKKR